jgi:hypothetical protein
LDELSHHPYLDSINLVVDPVLQAFCCTICKIALCPGAIKGHLHDNHPLIKLNQNRLDHIIDINDISLDLPISPVANTLDGLEPFKGLKILDGFGCTQCPQVYGHIKAIHTHYQQVHDNPCPSEFPKCYMQQLANGGANRKLWRVKAITQSSNDTSHDFPLQVLQHLRSKLDQNIDHTKIPQDDRVISPWLLMTRWHELVASHDVSFLRALISYTSKSPHVDRINGIHTAVLNYFEEAMELLASTDDLILKKLNSPELSKEYV